MFFAGGSIGIRGKHKLIGYSAMSQAIRTECLVTRGNLPGKMEQYLFIYDATAVRYFHVWLVACGYHSLNLQC